MVKKNTLSLKGQRPQWLPTTRRLALESLYLKMYDTRQSIEQLEHAEYEIAKAIAEQKCPFECGQIVRRGRFHYKVLDINPTGHGLPDKSGRCIGWSLDVIQVTKEGKKVRGAKRRGCYLWHKDELTAVTLT